MKTWEILVGKAVWALAKDRGWVCRVTGHAWRPKGADAWDRVCARCGRRGEG